VFVCGALFEYSSMSDDLNNDLFNDYEIEDIILMLAVKLRGKTAENGRDPKWFIFA
jgi:hypothetical protein